MSFEDFLFLALVDIFFNEAEPLSHLVLPIHKCLLVSIQKSSCCYRASFGSKRSKVWEEMSKIDFQDGGCGGHLGFSIG